MLDKNRAGQEHRNDKKLKFRGVHHLVLNTDDIQKTIDFYWGVLGMPLVHGMKVPPGVSRGNPEFERIRHYFFDMGGDSLLAFFEIPKGAKNQVDRDDIGAMQHVSFCLLPSEVEELCRRLDAAGVDRYGPMEAAPGVHSTYFYDPNGIRLEVSYQPAHGDDQQILQHFTQKPDALLDELRTVTEDDGWLDWASGPVRNHRT